jgi:hypothetical protein
MKTSAILTFLVSLELFLPTASAQSLDPRCPQCGSASVITDENVKKTTIESLQMAFRRIGEGQITGCSLVLQESFGRGFSAFGGFCDAVITGKKTQWMICNDNGVGNFAAVTGARWWLNPKEFLSRFIDSNCVGG